MDFAVEADTMDLGRYVAARQRLDQFVLQAGLLSYSDGTLAPPQIRPRGGVEGGKGASEAARPEDAFEEIAISSSQRDAQLRARIRQILQEGGLTQLIPGDQASLYDQLDVSHSTPSALPLRCPSLPALSRSPSPARSLPLSPSPRSPPLPFPQREARVYGSTQFGLDDKPQFPRLPAEEGLFVPPRPDVPDFNLYKVDARLLREDPRTRVFFDDDGNIKVRPRRRPSPPPDPPSVFPLPSHPALRLPLPPPRPVDVPGPAGRTRHASARVA